VVFETAAGTRNNTNFQYTFDVYVDGTKKHTSKSWPEPEYNTGVYSPNRIFENYLTYDLQPTISTPTTKPNSIISGSVIAGQSWSSGSVTVTGSTEDLGTVYLINAAFDYKDELLKDIESQYIPESGSKSNFLTEHYTGSIKLTDYATLGMLNGNASQYAITTYTSDGTYIAGYKYDLTAAPSGLYEKSLELPSGPVNLNAGTKDKWNTVSASWEPYTGSIVDSSVSYYDVYASYYGDYEITHRRRYTVDTECTKYDNVQVMWLNKFGAWEYFTFDKVSRDNIEKDNTPYRRRYYKHNASNRYDYTAGDRAQTILTSDIQESITLVSNYVNDNNSKRLKELFTSPEVYLLESDGTTYPMIVANTSWETKKTINDKLINYTVILDYAYKGNIQRG